MALFILYYFLILVLVRVLLCQNSGFLSNKCGQSGKTLFSLSLQNSMETFIIDNLLIACPTRDIQCISQFSDQFLEQTSKGVMNTEIVPIDPLIIADTFTVSPVEDMELKLHFKNINVTGLKTQKISDFQMDKTTKSVLLKTKADLNIVADLTVELQDKLFSGVYQASASVFGTARYNYDLIKNAEGIDFFVVGPETLTCEMTEEPTVSLSKELEDALTKDPNAQSKSPAYQENRVTYRKYAFCKIAEKAYVFVVHNIRAAAKIVPAKAFFTDI